MPMERTSMIGGGRRPSWAHRPGAQVLTRREALRIGLGGGALAWLGRGCQQGEKKPDPPNPPPGDKPVYELPSGDSLYDDFDGHGCLQSYDGRNLATAGALCERLWSLDGGSRVVDAAILSPAPLSMAGNHSPDLIPGLAAVPNNILEIGCVGQMMTYAWLLCPREITFADFGSLRADVRLSSRSTAPHPIAGLNFHTTIPEQPPGRSWWVTLGIFKDLGGPGAVVVGQYGNVNLGLVQNDLLGAVALDEWHALRLDIVTRADDPGLGPQDLRLDYYLDGERGASRIPEDSAILIDPARTGLGPHRSLIVTRDGYEGDAYAYFDNVRGRYNNRIA
jgi:hypothetical protein